MPTPRILGFPARLESRKAEEEQRRKREDPFTDIERAQELTREGVIASGELLRPELLARIGDTLGGLNTIGALRSGGTEVALRDISREFTDRFGNIATAATLGAGGIGLGAADIRLRREQDKNQRRRSLLGAIGGVVGAGLGFALGGPPGAVAGSQVAG